MTVLYLKTKNLQVSVSFLRWILISPVVTKNIYFIFVRARTMSLVSVLYCRYPSQVRRTTEENVKWERIRAPPVDTPPFTPHVSDCLHDLKPGDHIEIQWKSHDKRPYGFIFSQSWLIYFRPPTLNGIRLPSSSEIALYRLVVCCCWSLGTMRWEYESLSLPSQWYLRLSF